MIKDNRLVSSVLQNVGTGCVSIFSFDSPQPRQYAAEENYVSWAAIDPEACLSGDGTSSRGELACGTATPGPRATGHADVSLRWTGNWTMDELVLSGANLIDRFKTRMNIANIHHESGYDEYCCPVFMGLKHYSDEDLTAPVRILRFAKGALSGIGTSRNDWYYGSHLVFRTRLRVHSGPGDLRAYLDFSGDGTFGDLYTQKYPPGQVPDLPADNNRIGGNDSSAQLFDRDDYEVGELNWSLIHTTTSERILLFVEETDPFDFEGDTTHYYSDYAQLDDSPDARAGTLGSSGTFWHGGAWNMQDNTCAEAQGADHVWREAYWHLVPMAADRDVSEYVDWLQNDLVVVSYAVDRNAEPPGPSNPPCPPSLEIEVEGNGDYASLTPSLSPGSQGCENALYSVYRAIGAGAFRQLASVPAGQAHLDRSVGLGVTYRYRAYAHNRFGETSDGSAIVSVSIEDSTPPDPPSSVVLEPLSGAIRVSWSQSSSRDLAGTDILVSDTPGGPYLRASGQLVPRSTSEFVLAALDPSTTYYFVLVAVDYAGLRSEPTSEVQAQPGF